MEALRTPPESLLDPLVILLMPRWTSAVPALHAAPAIAKSADFAIALADGEEEAARFERCWTGTAEPPLLLLRVPMSHSIAWAEQAILDLAKNRGGRAIGVLLADGPELAGFVSGKRRAWNRALADAVHAALLDSQILQYSSTWLDSPPRVR